MSKYKAFWSGQRPALCSGEWLLLKDNVEMSFLIPEEIRQVSMDTYNVYEKWNIGEDLSIYYTKYTDGLTCDDWIKKNLYWLENITNNRKEQEEIYLTFRDNDFRINSCGGCLV